MHKLVTNKITQCLKKKKTQPTNMRSKIKGSEEWKNRPIILGIWDFPSKNGIHPMQEAACSA